MSESCIFYIFFLIKKNREMSFGPPRRYFVKHPAIRNHWEGVLQLWKFVLMSNGIALPGVTWVARIFPPNFPYPEGSSGTCRGGGCTITIGPSSLMSTHNPSGTDSGLASTS